MAAKRVLLAEDEPNIVELLRFLLEREGFGVSVVGDGRLAIDHALAEPPDVVILDVMLPRVDGLEVLRELRATARCRHVPVIMLTARGQRIDRDAALETGADVFMTKPFSNAEVVAAVSRLTGAHTA